MFLHRLVKTNKPLSASNTKGSLVDFSCMDLNFICLDYSYPMFRLNDLFFGVKLRGDKLFLCKHFPLRYALPIIYRIFHVFRANLCYAHASIAES